jgi:hypothetical protein
VHTSLNALNICICISLWGTSLPDGFVQWSTSRGLNAASLSSSNVETGLLLFLVFVYWAVKLDEVVWWGPPLVSPLYLPGSLPLISASRLAGRSSCLLALFCLCKRATSKLASLKSFATLLSFCSSTLLLSISVLADFRDSPNSSSLVPGHFSWYSYHLCSPVFCNCVW